MNNKLIFGLVLISSLFSLRTWFACNRLTDPYYFSPFDLQLRLIEAIHSDMGIPLFVVRLFHNKVVGTVLDVFHSYILFWDLRFVFSLIGPAMFALAVIGIYVLLKNKKPLFFLLILALLALFPFIQILFRSAIPFSFWIAAYSILFMMTGFYGSSKIRITKWSLLFIFSMIVLSWWWNSVYSPLLLEFCVR